MTTSLEPRTDALAASVLSEGWEYSDAETQRLTHNVHRYSGKFIPQVASRALSLLTNPGDVVVDPYCGSGTTLVECALLRRIGFGIDLNPLAVLISKVKTTPVPEMLLRELVADLSEKLGRVGRSEELSLFAAAGTDADDEAEKDPRLAHEWYRKWFQPEVLRELVIIDRTIDRLRDERLRNIARVALSGILRRSSNAHSGYPNVMFDKRAPEKPRPIRPFLNALDRIASMVQSLSQVEASWSDVKAMNGNATALPFDDASVDAVITHPPYIGSIPYAEYGALSLVWLGTDPKKLDRELTGGRRQSPDVVRRFEDGYGKMLRESARVLKPGKYAFVMVGNPVVRGEVVDLAEMTLNLATQAGLVPVARTERRGINRRANKMGAEQLLFFQRTS